ncbi:MAG: bacillithiol biosynthesis cysteine-adding enzyme BshC [Sediminibacterium sp.]|nr:bacillithiol biosynthesis cysteine-adding enzyme BshC [Sediminibacterium sp.]
MHCSTTYLPYAATHAFSSLVTDYLAQVPAITAFQLHAPTYEGISAAIETRKKYLVNRKLLVNALHKQYTGLSVSDQVANNIELLLAENTFTITTAHQPNIFTGPLYFIYKILHTVKLCEELKEKFPSENFVPIYYMGSEDADLEELGFINAGDQHLIWETKQEGAVGRMKVDKPLLKILGDLERQIAVLPHGTAWITLLRNCYTEGKTIQQATLELVNELFGKYGVVVVIPDNAELKSLFRLTVEKELVEKFSESIVAETTLELAKHYKVQAAGRPINLFYLIDDKRERIEVEGERDKEEGIRYKVKGLGLSFTQEEILKELYEHPERFSANVILRGVFQGTILPDIAFIGGGGELAYWLELKNVFAAAGVPYPVLILRNSFVFIEPLVNERIQKQHLSDNDLFETELTLINALVTKNTKQQLRLSEQIEQVKLQYQFIQMLAAGVDKSLVEHAKSLEARTVKLLAGLEKKIFRAEKRKYETDIQQIQFIKKSLFPANSLQERHQNIALFYAKYGPGFIDSIYKASTGLAQEFCVVKYIGK